MPVYDDERQDLSNDTGAPLTDDEQQRFNDIEQGYYDDQFNDITNNQPGNPNASRQSRSLLGREREAATGRAGARRQMGKGPANPNIQRGGLGVPKEEDKPSSGLIRGGLGSAGLRAKEQDAEQPHLFRDDSSGGKGGSRFQSLKTRRNMWIAGSLIGLVTGGGGLSFLGILSGPAQLVQVGQMMQLLHFDEKNTQEDSRTLHLARNMAYRLLGKPERTRMSTMGNIIADGITGRMEAAGFKPVIEQGVFKGYLIDPAKLRGDDFSDLSDNERNQSGAKQFLQERLNIPTETAADGKLFYAAGGRIRDYFSDKRALRSTLKLAGYNEVVGAVASHFMKQRFNITYHPMKKLQEKGEKKFQEWLDSFKKYVRKGSKVVAPGVERSGDGNQSDADDAKDLENQAQGVGDDPTKLQEFGKKIAGKLNSPLNLVGLLCLTQFISDQFDNIARDNIIIPMVRMAMYFVSMAAQITAGVDVDLDQMGYLSNQLYDAKTKTSWSDARSVNAETDRAASGPDLPGDAKLNQEGNAVTRFVHSIPGVSGACSTTGQVVIVIASIAVLVISGGGAVAAAVSFATGLFVSAGISALSSMIANFLTANVIPAIATGALLGNIINYGARLAANDMAISGAGLPIPDAEAKLLSDATKADQDYEFSKESLATRLFDPNDPRTLLGQVLQKQAPDPVDNVSKFADSFLNIGKTFGSLLLKPFNQVLNAAPIASNYDYGFQDAGFTKAEMNNVNLENPFDNADKVVDILDQNSEENEPTITNADGQQVPNNENYIVRAKTCFGVTISKVTEPDSQGNQVQQYKVNPPVPGEIPTSKTILTQDDNGNATHCMDGQLTGDDVNVQPSDWLRVRVYIAYSKTTNALGCLMGKDDDPNTKQACIDIGYTASPTAGATGNAPNCASTGGTGGAIQGAGPLNNAIPANPVLDGNSAAAVGALEKPSYGNIHEYGLTVVCSSASDPQYTVSSGNPDWGPNAFDQVVTTKTGSGSCNPLHIPAGTEPPGGSDKWVIVIDSTKPGLYCMMWIGEPSWSMAYGGVYDLNGGGPPELAGSGSGSNIPQSPILASEVQAGVINHALGFAGKDGRNKSGVFRPPATKTDGSGGGPLEEGMRFQLDPTFDCNSISNKTEKAICVALQVYGAYDVDNTGGGTGWFFQNNDNGVYNDPANGISGDYQQFPDIPLDRMRLLAKWEGN